MNIKKLFGFTLAEVLFSMAIIGVVAAMTMPTLSKNFHDKLYTTQIKKTYGEIESVIEKYMSDKRTEDLRELRGAYTAAQVADDLARNYFDVTLDCGGGSTYTSGCFAAQGQYKTYNKTAIDKIRIHNGSCTKAVLLSTSTALCITVGGLADDLIGFEIDVNGPKPPNTAGRDLFTLAVSSNGNLQDPNCGFSLAGSPAACPCTATSYNVKFGSGFLHKLIEKGWKMDYSECEGVN
jgi:prepilin-type N-terminal cleavage/methylation domain-containing protein